MSQFDDAICIIMGVNSRPRHVWGMGRQAAAHEADIIEALLEYDSVSNGEFAFLSDEDGRYIAGRFTSLKSRGIVTEVPLSEHQSILIDEAPNPSGKCWRLTDACAEKVGMLTWSEVHA